MVSSVANKDLSHEWENERYKDYQESMQNFQSSAKSQELSQKQSKKSAKQEIYLPKTRLSRTGQLLLFTAEDYDKELYETRINSMLAKKAYTKKWLDDVDHELNLETSKFLDERLDENLNTFINSRNNRLTKIMGKNSKYLIQDLKVKSGRDRRLQRASYLEYLPSDFDPKNELADALKSINNTQPNFERTSSSHQNRYSAFSYAEIADCNDTSDDEKTEKAPSVNVSRLSSQPILSAQNLINRLSCTANTGYLIQAKSPEKSKSLEEVEKKIDPAVAIEQENDLLINYKETFDFHYLKSESQNALKKIESSSAKVQETKNDKKIKNEPQKKVLNSKKILDKRFVLRVQNSSPVNTTTSTENLEAISIKQSKSNPKNSVTITKSNSQRNSATLVRPVMFSGARRKTLSPKLDDNDNSDNLTILGSKKLDNEENLPNLLHRTQNSLYSSFVNNRTPNTPLPSHDKVLTSTGQTFKPSVHFKSMADDETLEPITISVTEIENESTGNSIKIRRFFDRQSIRINKMNISKDPKFSFIGRENKSLSAHSARRRTNRNESQMDPQIENFPIKLVTKNSSTKNEDRAKSAPLETQVIDISKITQNVDPNSIESSRIQSAAYVDNEKEKNDNIDLKINATDRPANDTETQKAFEKLDLIVIEENEGGEKIEFKSENLQNGEIKNEDEHKIQDDFSENFRNSDHDKNIHSIDYVDNLSISSRISSRKNSYEGDWYVYDENGDKLDTESEAYEKLIRSVDNSEQANMGLSSNSLNDYQEIIIENRREYVDDNTKQVEDEARNNSYFNPDQRGQKYSSEKIETILEESAENSKMSFFQKSLEQMTSEKPQEPEIQAVASPEIAEKIIEEKSNDEQAQEEFAQEPLVKIEKTEKAEEIPLIENNLSSIEVTETVNKDSETTKDSTPNDEVKPVTPPRVNSPTIPSIQVDEIEKGVEATKKAQVESGDEKIEESPKTENVNEVEEQVSKDIDRASPKIYETLPIKSVHFADSGSSRTSFSPVKETPIIENQPNPDDQKISISIVINQPEFMEESNSTFNNKDIESLIDKNEPELVVFEENENDYILNKQKSEDIEVENREDLKSNSINSKELTEMTVAKEITSKDAEDLMIKIEPLIDTKQEEIKMKSSDKAISLNTEDDPKSNERQIKKVEFSNNITEKIIPNTRTFDELPATNNLTDNKKTESVAMSKIQMVDSVESNKPAEKNNDKTSTLNAHPPAQKPPTNRPSSRVVQSSKQPVKIKTNEVDKKETPKIDQALKVEQIETPKPAPKFDFSKFNDLLGVKKEEPKEEEIKSEPKKFVKESKFEKKMREKRERYKNFPYLQVPWDSAEPIVDQDAYREAFTVPDVLSPLIHTIDPTTTSVDELVLERRILEDKILELRQEKLNILNMTNEDRAKLAKKNEKKKGSKKQEVVKVNKEADLKDRIIREERIRLQHEAHKKQLEREHVGKLLENAIFEKEKETQNLNKELEGNQKELNSQLNGIMEQVNYLEGTEDQIREALAQARTELRERIKKNQQTTRKNLKEMQDERRESKLFDFSVKQKELEWLIGMYTDSPDEIAKIKSKQSVIEAEIEQWLFRFENDCIDQEKELEDKEAEEDNLLMTMEHEEEETALSSIKQEQFELLQEKKNLIENFEEIKHKIIQRIQKVTEEKLHLEEEKKQFELNILFNIEKQKEKLMEIMIAEEEAKEEIKKDLENYKENLLLKREKNLSLKSDLSFLTHCHNITKPHVFSYVMHWPIELFAKPFDQDKFKKTKPKK